MNLQNNNVVTCLPEANSKRKNHLCYPKPSAAKSLKGITTHPQPSPLYLIPIFYFTNSKIRVEKYIDWIFTLIFMSFPLKWFSLYVRITDTIKKIYSE